MVVEMLGVREEVGEEQDIWGDAPDIEGLENFRILEQDAPRSKAHRHLQVLRNLGQGAVERRRPFGATDHAGDKQRG